MKFEADKNLALAKDRLAEAVYFLSLVEGPSAGRRMVETLMHLTAELRDLVDALIKNEAQELTLPNSPIQVGQPSQST